MDSLWTQTAEMPRFEGLHQDVKTDVLIIGGGMAGLLCACLLHRDGVSYVLVEAQRVCGGIPGHTTAKLTVQHGLICQRLIHTFGADRARQYLQANEEALEQYRRLCRDIDCDFEEKTAYVYALDDARKIEREIRALEQLGGSAEFTRDLPLPFPVAGAVGFPHQAQFHPLKFAAAIAKDLHIYENTPVRELVGTTAVTDGGTISAEKIIVATHFPFLNKHGSYFLKQYQHRSYVIALENAPQMDGMYVSRYGGDEFVCLCMDLEDRDIEEYIKRVGRGPAAGGRRRPPHREAGRELAGAAGLRPPPLSPGCGKIPLGRPGLHDPGRSALYRSLFGRHLPPVCGHRVQQVGHDVLHGGGSAPAGPGAGERKSLCSRLLALQDDPAPPAGGQRLRGGGGLAGAHRQALPASGLRPEVEPP